MKRFRTEGRKRIYQIMNLSFLFSYIAYKYDPETSCADCDKSNNVTVINPVMVLLPYLVDKVRPSHVG